MDMFYIYAFFELDGTPFYIGKGYGSRDTDHFRLCRHKNTKNDCPDFYARLRELLDSGIKPDHRRLVKNLPLPTARILEKFFIDALGRIDLDTGPLTNLTDGRSLGPRARQRMSKSKTVWFSSLTPKEKKQRIETIVTGLANRTEKEKKTQSKNQSKAAKTAWANLTPKEMKRRKADIASGLANRTEKEKKAHSDKLSKSAKAREERKRATT